MPIRRIERKWRIGNNEVFAGDSSREWHGGFCARASRTLPHRHFARSINERWDCGIVNHSPYATLGGIPVAVIGIAGYFLLGVLALRRAYRSLVAAALPGLAFSLYLAHIEAHVLGVWCVYCVASLGVISAISLLALGTTIIRLIRKNRATRPGD